MHPAIQPTSQSAINNDENIFEGKIGEEMMSEQHGQEWQPPLETKDSQQAENEEARNQSQTISPSLKVEEIEELNL